MTSHSLLIAFSFDFSISVAISRIELSLCSLFYGLWWVEDISPSFASTIPAFSGSTQCLSSSKIQQLYILPFFNILPFWIRFLQVFPFSNFHVTLSCSNYFSVHAQMVGHASKFWLEKNRKSCQCWQILFLYIACCFRCSAKVATETVRFSTSHHSRIMARGRSFENSVRAFCLPCTSI